MKTGFDDNFPLLVSKWIKAFLMGRTHQVKIGPSDFLSSSFSCTSGVPQGLCLDQYCLFYLLTT